MTTLGFELSELLPDTTEFVWRQSSRAKAGDHACVGVAEELLRVGQEIRWEDLAGDTTLASWSAGSDLAVGVLVSKHCRQTVDISAPGLSVAPDGAHLLEFPTRSSPVAGLSPPALWSANSRRRVWRGMTSKCARVVSVEWSSDAVAIQCFAPDGRPSRLVVQRRE